MKDDDDEQCILFGRFSGIALLPRSSDEKATDANNRVKKRKAKDSLPENLQ